METAGQTLTEGGPTLTLRLQGRKHPTKKQSASLPPQKETASDSLDLTHICSFCFHRKKKTVTSSPPFHLPKTSWSSQAWDRDRSTRSPSTWSGTTAGGPRPPKQSPRVSSGSDQQPDNESLFNTFKKVFLSSSEIDAPPQVEVKDVTDTSALVGWSQPLASVDRITMFYGLISDPSDTNSVEVFPPDKQHSVDGLRPDTQYKVTLISRRGDATSDPVSTSFITGMLQIDL